MSLILKRDDFDKYIVNMISIHRKIMLTLFDLELTKNELLKNEVEAIRNCKTVDKTFFFYEGVIDYSSMIKLLVKYNSSKTKRKIELLIDTNKDDEHKLLKTLLDNSLILRNDLWHNCIEYNNPKKYYKIFSNFKNAYELFLKNKSINKKELFENSIKYLDICLDFFKNNEY